jgi:hypothetical protein
MVNHYESDKHNAKALAYIQCGGKINRGIFVTERPRTP